MKTQEFIQELSLLAQMALRSEELSVRQSAGVLLLLAASLTAGQEYHNEVVLMAKDLNDKHLVKARLDLGVRTITKR